jgi:hypothetical protein
VITELLRLDRPAKQVENCLPPQLFDIFADVRVDTMSFALRDSTISLFRTVLTRCAGFCSPRISASFVLSMMGSSLRASTEHQGRLWKLVSVAVNCCSGSRRRRILEQGYFSWLLRESKRCYADFRPQLLDSVSPFAAVISRTDYSTFTLDGTFDTLNELFAMSGSDEQKVDIAACVTAAVGDAPLPAGADSIIATLAEMLRPSRGQSSILHALQVLSPVARHRGIIFSVHCSRCISVFVPRFCVGLQRTTPSCSGTP